jgi:hypothetical protein
MISEHSGQFVQRGDVVELVGIEARQLSAVTFVRDYIQLSFDGPVITTVTFPVVSIGEHRFAREAPGYRDQLCRVIGKTVIRAYVKPDDHLQIDFSDEFSITVSLRPEDHRGRSAEAVLYLDGPAVLAVW